MTRTIRISLLTDGSSDRCLLVLLRRLIGDLAGDVDIESHWTDFRHIALLTDGSSLDEKAIRHAADNPSGADPLGLPAPRAVESDPDPKQTLAAALVTASSKRGRRLRQFRETMGKRVQRVAELTTEYARLREVPAFSRLQSDIVVVLKTVGPSVG